MAGKTLAQAKQILQQAGFTNVVETTGADNNRAVTGTNPTKGSKVTAGTQIVIIVGPAPGNG